MSPELADLSLLELFSMELATHRQAMEDALVDLASDASPGRLESLMRAAHSIKGAARIVNLGRAADLAHAMEDLFQAAQKGRLGLSAARVDALLAANDFFGRLGDAPPAEMPALLDSSAAEAARLEEALRDLTAEPDQAPHAVDQAGNADPLQAPSQHPQRPGAQAAPVAPVAPVAEPGASSSEAPSPLPVSGNRQEAVVRLSASVLGRLMGLAGQCVVEAGAMGRIFARVRAERRGFLDLTDLLEELRPNLTQPGDKARIESALALVKDMAQAHAQAVVGMDGLTRRMEILSDRLYGQVLGSRMRPFGEGARPLARLVRDLSRDLGREATFVLTGADTAVDRDILEKLEAPLLHLARNAVDHGLEPPAEREAKGKARAGRVTADARHVAGSLEVRLHDDGRGIDPGALRAAVVARGLADRDLAARLGDAELYEFLFLPGFTTATALTQVSGRGVGLDVVKTMLQEVGGQARVESTPGRGTTFVLRLPVSRSVIRALVVQVAGEPYALPLSRIGRVVSAAHDELHSLSGRQYLQLDGASVGLAPAAQILRRPDSPPQGGELSVVILEGQTGRFGLVVDAFLGERDLVVHPLDPRLGRVPNVSAASILEDGSPTLILDEADLLRSLEILLVGGSLARVGGAFPDPAGDGRRGPKKVLVVDDSLTVREVERQLLAGRGYRTETAVDGMEGLALARSGGFDLIVTDVDMPRMTGIELTRAIKADPALAATPVMIVSYKDRPEDQLAGLSAGADHYLAKSGFRDQALLDAVADLIGVP
jgi:two-component system sensor histidine kinase and response regulator WspE